MRKQDTHSASNKEKIHKNNRQAKEAHQSLNISCHKASRIAGKLLRKAFNEGRGQEMYAEISRRIDRVKEWAAEDAGEIAFARELDKITKSPTLRRFNMEAQKAGEKTFLGDHTGTKTQNQTPAQSAAEENPDFDLDKAARIFSDVFMTKAAVPQSAAETEKALQDNFGLEEREPEIEEQAKMFAGIFPATSFVP